MLILSPIKGENKALDQVSDPVFAKKMMGDGIAIIPRTETIYSPIDGVISAVFPSKHAIGITAKNHLELLIHIGLETVELEGEGFTEYVEMGEEVKVGDKLIDFDLKKIEQNGKETDIMIVITKVPKNHFLEHFAVEDLDVGMPILSLE